MITGEASPFKVVVPMTYATATDLLKRGRDLLTEGEQVAFDLAGVPAADSSSLAVILGWLRTAGHDRLRLLNVPASVASLAELYGIDGMLPLS